MPALPPSIPIERVHEVLEERLKRYPYGFLAVLARAMGVTPRHLRRIRQGKHPDAALQALRLLGAEPQLVVEYSRRRGLPGISPSSHQTNGTTYPFLQLNARLPGGRRKQTTLNIGRRRVRAAFRQAIETVATWRGEHLSEAEIEHRMQVLILSHYDWLYEHGLHDEV